MQPSAVADQRNDRLESLFCEWLQRRQRGEVVALDALCGNDAALAAHLADRVAQFQEFSNTLVGMSPASEQTSAAAADKGPATTPFGKTPKPEHANTLAGQTGSADLAGANEALSLTLSEQLLATGVVEFADLQKLFEVRPEDVEASAAIKLPSMKLDKPLTPIEERFWQQVVHLKLLTVKQVLIWLEKRLPKLLLSNYEILEPIGAGGMGQVYKARHRRMEREVALKILPAAAMQTPNAVERFHREVKAAAKLHHPNIVAAFDADEAEGLHFLVMEFVPGVDLSRWVRHKGPMSVALTLKLFVQALRSLQYAHAQGIIHRDIKPSNFLMTNKGELKLLDLGLVRQIDGMGTPKQETLTESGSYMGTVDYMAPEQATDASKVDHRADLYSLGCTLYYLLTGDAVVQGNTVVERLVAHRLNPTPNLLAKRNDVPAALQTMFARLMEKEPAERYQSAESVLQDLRTSGLLDLSASDSSNSIIHSQQATHKLDEAVLKAHQVQGKKSTFPEPLEAIDSKLATQQQDGSTNSPSSKHPKTALPAAPAAAFDDTSDETVNWEEVESEAGSFHPPAVRRSTANTPVLDSQSTSHNPRPYLLVALGAVATSIVIMLTLLAYFLLLHQPPKPKYGIIRLSGILDGVDRATITAYYNEPAYQQEIVQFNPEDASIRVARARGRLEFVLPGRKTWSVAFNLLHEAEINVPFILASVNELPPAPQQATPPQQPPPQQPPPPQKFPSFPPFPPQPAENGPGPNRPRFPLPPGPGPKAPQ